MTPARLPGPAADLLVTAARVYPDASGRPAGEAVLVRGGRVVEVGRLSDLEGPAAGASRLDLPGSTVLPGFVDDHAHLLHTGLTRFTVRLDEVGAREEAAELLREAETDLVVATGLDEYRFSPGEFPDAAWLDGVLDGRPAILKGITGHYAVANRRALEVLGVPLDLEGLDPATGYLRGRANTEASRVLRRHAVDEIGPPAVFRAGAEMAAARGATTVHALEGWDEPEPLEAGWLLEEQHRLPVRTLVWAQTTHVPSVVGWGLPRIGGDIWVDGDFGPRTALLRQPYADGGGHGTAYYRPEELAAFATEAAEAGLQVAMHCVGDGAAEMALDAYRAALDAHPTEDHRFRIEHFEVAPPDLLERTARMGVAVSLQPPFDCCFGGQPRCLPWAGPGRVETIDAVRSFLEAGILCGGGSDSPVTPLDPLLGLYACTNHSNPDQSVDVAAAVRLYTEGSARLGFVEDLVGALRPGMLGDLVVLDRDPFRVPVAELADLEVLAAVVGGEVVHRA